MAQVILRGCCKFCQFSRHFEAYGRVTKKTKLICSHKDNIDDLRTFIIDGMTHENGFCENFEWGDKKNRHLILSAFDNMKEEERN
jgi:hypothetical protein